MTLLQHPSVECADTFHNGLITVENRISEVFLRPVSWLSCEYEDDDDESVAVKIYSKKIACSLWNFDCIHILYIVARRKTSSPKKDLAISIEFCLYNLTTVIKNIIEICNQSQLGCFFIEIFQ